MDPLTQILKNSQVFGKLREEEQEKLLAAAKRAFKPTTWQYKLKMRALSRLGRIFHPIRFWVLAAVIFLLDSPWRLIQAAHNRAGRIQKYVRDLASRPHKVVRNNAAPGWLPGDDLLLAARCLAEVPQNLRMLARYYDVDDPLHKLLTVIPGPTPKEALAAADAVDENISIGLGMAGQMDSAFGEGLDREPADGEEDPELP